MRIVPPNQPVPDSGPSAGGGRSAASEPAENVAPPAAEAETPPVAPASDPTAAGPEPRPSLSAGTSHANLVGHVLAERYRLMKLIGEGGMGSVYQAEHITIGRKLAIKVLAPEYCDSPEVVARFLQEARTASMLHHEHIVDITDFGYTKQGLAFLTMEYLEGEDLATLLQREGRQPWSRLRRMILQVCRALNAAHEKGIVHRDMKPDNCFRIKRGGNPDFIKILDFGIAKVIADGQFGGREDKPKMATEAGTLLGTPEYMAPEIARDQKADARVDVYSLGILMYEMLTGSVPFKGQTFMATVAMQMVDEPVAPRQRCPEAQIPPEIEAVILTALRKDPAERYQSVRELAEAILEADASLRMTQQGLPALRFESGEYPANGANASESSMIRAAQLGGASLGTSGAFAPMRGPGPGTATPPPRPAGPAGPSASHAVVPIASHGGTVAPTPTPRPVERASLGEPASDLDEPSAITRPNPYRALSVLLLLVVAGLGAAIWYLLERTEPAVDPANIGHDPAIHPGDPVPVPVIPHDTKTVGTPNVPPEATAGDPPDPTAGKSEKPTPKKKDPPAALVDATKEEINEYSGTLIADVTRCFSSHNLPRQRVSFLIDVEAATGKVKANVESPLGNPGFISCAEKSVAKKRFKKGRKHTTFHANLNL